MKKIVSLLLALTALTTMSSTVFADYDPTFDSFEEPVSLDPLNNELYEVVATLKDAEEGQGEIYDELIETEWLYEEQDENGEYRVYNENFHKIIYMDGSVVTKSLGTTRSLIDFHIPDKRFMEFSEERNFNEYIMTENLNYRSDMNIYKVTVENKEITSKELKYTVREKEELMLDINKATEVDGEIVEELYKTISMSELDDYYYEWSSDGEFNDGLIYNEDYHLVDINGDIHYFEGQLTYHGIDYNLGYLNENFNNGGVLDWSLPDPEKYRTFDTTIYDIFGEGSFYFENTKIDPIRDDGYSLITINIDGNKSEHIIRLKRPAIVTVYLDGEKIKFDQIPVIEEGRTLVPLRAIFDALGAEILWDDATKTVTATKDETEIKLTIDNKTASKNNEAIKLDVPAKIINGRTMVPARFVADCFGVNVDWDGEMKKVLLTR